MRIRINPWGNYVFIDPLHENNDLQFSLLDAFSARVREVADRLPVILYNSMMTEKRNSASGQDMETSLPLQPVDTLPP